MRNLRGDTRVECGGYASHETQVKSLLGKAKGLKTFHLIYATETVRVSFKADLESGEYSSEIRVGERDDPGEVSFNGILKAEERANLSEAVFAGTLLDYNGFSVHVNGLPLIEDCSLSMTFEEGEEFHCSFNGARGPMGFREEVVKLFPLVFELGHYTPGKGRPYMPPMSSILGTHRFEFTEGKKKGTLTVNIESMYQRKDVEGQGELFSEGDFGKKHFRINTSYVCSGNGRYDLYLVKEYEDSVGKTPDSWKFAAMLTKDYRGDLQCEAFSAMPDLNDRKAVYESEKVEMLSSAYFYQENDDSCRTCCLYRESNESMEYFLRIGEVDFQSGRFFYKVYKADPAFVKGLEAPAITLDPWKYREYFELGSKEPARSKKWLELNFRYGRSVILSEEAILEAAKRLKSEGKEGTEETKEAHLELFEKMCRMMEEPAKDEDIVLQGACPSGREVAEFYLLTGNPGVNCLVMTNEPELPNNPFYSKGSHPRLKLRMEKAVTPDTVLSPEELLKVLR